MWQAYWTLDVEEWKNGWKAVRLEAWKTFKDCRKLSWANLHLLSGRMVHKLSSLLMLSLDSCFECIHAIGFMHQYVLVYGQAIIIAWRFAILGDFEVDELEGQEGLNILRFAMSFWWQILASTWHNSNWDCCQCCYKYCAWTLCIWPVLRCEGTWHEAREWLRDIVTMVMLCLSRITLVRQLMIKVKPCGPTRTQSSPRMPRWCSPHVMVKWWWDVWNVLKCGFRSDQMP